MSNLKGKNYLGYFGIGDVIDTLDLSLSEPFLAILATIAYWLTVRSEFVKEVTLYGWQAYTGLKNCCGGDMRDFAGTISVTFILVSF